MKNLRIFILICFLLSTVFASIIALTPNSAVLAEGRLSIPFESDENGDVEGFDCYTQVPSEREYFTRDGFLYTEGKTESKFILKSPQQLASFTMTADFYPLDEICPLNAGFYFYASRARNELDGIKGWNLQVEKAVNSSYFYLKLHYFNQAWYGTKAETYLKINKLPITVTLVADQGQVEAYVDGYTGAVLTYNVSDDMWSAASVGFRMMCECGAKIGNFSITTDKLDANTAELTKLLDKANNVDLNSVVESSKTAITDAITQAQTALESNSQAIVDAAVAALKIALENKKDKFSYDDFSIAITQATEIVASGEGLYTENTFNSLKLAISRSIGLTVESSEDEISEATTLIKSRIANLTSYRVKN